LPDDITGVFMFENHEMDLKPGENEIKF
jgi:hypothetical protein